MHATEMLVRELRIRKPEWIGKAPSDESRTKLEEQ